MSYKLAVLLVQNFHGMLLLSSDSNRVLTRILKIGVPETFFRKVVTIIRMCR